MLIPYRRVAAAPKRRGRRGIPCWWPWRISWGVLPEIWRRVVEGGYDLAGTRRALKIPGIYTTIPLIVVTGARYQRVTITDDAGMSRHGLPNTAAGMPRYPIIIEERK